jgi:hypothetical protein
VAAPSNELFLFVREADRSVREGLADCNEDEGGISVSQLFAISVRIGCPVSLQHLHLSHVTSARMMSPILPPDAR